MEISVNENNKTVEIWLTNAEQEDQHTSQLLKHLFAEYKAQKYLVAVYTSGVGDLLDNTTSLIIHNRTAT